MKLTSLRKLLLGMLLTGATTSAEAVSLPAIIGHHMVLQRNAEVTIWGWGKTGEEITVTGSWDSQPVKTKANTQAKWSVTLQTSAAPGPHTVTVQGYNTLVLEDVLLGEVWLCSGQSNMEWSASMGIDNADQHTKEATYPSIRFFQVGHRTADAPQLDVQGQWVVCTPETMKYFSAVGYFFGREIHQKLNVPVGLINSSWGGTPAEVWLSSEAIASSPVLAEAAAKRKEVEWGPVQPAKAYNAMIAPLIPFRLAGALWYQGESNTDAPEVYAQMLPALIQDWRTAWKNEFSFYFAQIAPYTYGGAEEWPRLAEAQLKTLRVPNTGMAVLHDIGNVNDIHPRNKLDVGKRLAGLALNKTYGQKEVPASGPIYREMKKEGNKIRLYFDHADQGLMAKGKELTHFEIAGEDQRFVPAQARIDGKTLVVSAKEVKNPVAVRMGWSNTATPNLYNKAGLPASTFRTDNWPRKNNL
ncbi:sialate O-acetylesterase [Rufibacter glacialis]|uniref:Sialate O-acetylesterase n=1 Tax=Rufibacter glacialis TaxID=1259555 RepID=A0A5M8Q5T4_9BACT|nr:sialate O-acetylesterase [Rufibacter glacialis]KAA6430264.1 sialate O-acetylesterase [Rufibacter glacialis]GGK87809.1 9-O-acetylesterase [Rufibacter glacialis]